MKLNKNEMAIVRRTASTIATYEKKIETNKRKIDEIEEVFRKKAEEKKLQYLKAIEDLKSNIDFWEKPVIEKFGKTVKELLEENGVSKIEEQSLLDQPEETEVQEEQPEPVQEEKPVETVEPEEPIKVEESESVEDVQPEEPVKKETPEQKIPYDEEENFGGNGAIIDSDDDFPPFPEEWK